MKVVAEGVETAAQLDLLLAAGCDYGQGYLFFRPMSSAQFKRFIAVGPGNGGAGSPNAANSRRFINLEIPKKEDIHV